MIKIRFVFVLLFFISSLSAQIEPAFLSSYNEKWVDSVYQSLTLDEKIGQLLMPRGNYSGKPHDLETLKMWVKEYKIGGIVFFASNPHTQALVTNELQSLSKTPLFIGQDLEWGLGMRLDSTDRFPYAVSLGAINGGEEIMTSMGREIARQCKRLGVHINYAPVIDVNNNPNNPVINFRSFGANKENVAKKGLAYMKGMQGEGILCTAKHFPGHGDTDVDSHHDLPLISHDKNRLHEIELYPFKKLINNGLSGIMTAHLNIPALEPNIGLASTFSGNIVYKLLREELKFKGLTFTDAMEMQGAVKNFPKGEAMVKALLAGNDILETFVDVPGTVLAIKTAIKNGSLPLSVIEWKVKKILKAKSWVGLDRYKPIELDNLIPDLNTIQADVLNYQLTEKSITCLKNELNLLPVKNLQQKIAVLSFDVEGVSEFYSMTTNYAKADYYHLSKNSSVTKIDSVLKKLDQYDLVLAGIHLIDIRASKQYGLNPSNTQIIERLSTKNNVVISLFGNPYILTKIKELEKCKSLIMAYQQNNYTEKIVPQIIFGGLPAQGIFPIDISSVYHSGMSVTWENLGRLSYGIPEQVNIDRSFLTMGIDSIIGTGLVNKAYPGCVLQVAKDGKIIFEKAYGFQTYEDANQSESKNVVSNGNNYSFIDDAMDNPESLKTTLRPTVDTSYVKGKVKKDDIFDLASVTKISGATLAIMQLMSQNKLTIDGTLGMYCPSVRGSNKENLIMRDLLTHRAGLKAWIPFWRDAVDTIATMNMALKLNPALESSFVVDIKKPNFFQRIFGKKPLKTIDYQASIQRKPELWSQILQETTRIWKAEIFSNIQSNTYTVPVAKNLFLNKNYRNIIMNQITNSEVDTIKKYLYSDLHYYYYPEIVQYITGENYETYLDKTYKSIGANSITFNPWSKQIENKIIPTEFDSIFRQQLLQGYVHDEGAAMLGGISGHAGLFSNANDVMKLMQMYLQNGNYGDVTYIDRNVISECTAYQFSDEKNRRGIGFDKKDFDPSIQNAPFSASNESYGHSGYTGTYTWVEPKHNLVYVFLSNRVYPTRNNNKISKLNIRTAIGDHLIKSLKTKELSY